MLTNRLLTNITQEIRGIKQILINIYNSRLNLQKSLIWGPDYQLSLTDNSSGLILKFILHWKVANLNFKKQEA